MWCLPRLWMLRESETLCPFRGWADGASSDQDPGPSEEQVTWAGGRGLGRPDPQSRWAEVSARREKPRSSGELRKELHRLTFAATWA